MNIVFYVLDALRADHLSCYGYSRNTSPTIDSLAREGIRFEQCFSPSTWTRPVAASILTGSYPPTHDTQTKFDQFTPHVASLPERLSEMDFETVGFTAMGNVSTSVGFNRGFNQFFDLYKDDAIIEKRRTSTVTREELRQETDRSKIALPRAEDLTEKFKEWLKERDDNRPFFGFFWSIEPHIPYDPPSKYRTYVDDTYDGPVNGERDCLTKVKTDNDLEQLKALYDGEIAYNDACIGDLVKVLREVGEFEDTLLIVVGDHGDAFNEHGRLTHGHAPYDELVHVPCVIRTPDEAVSGVAEETLLSLVDLYPTIIEYVSAELDESKSIPEGVQGRSVADALRGTRIKDHHDYVYAKTNTYDMQNTFYGVRSDRWKYITVETPKRSGRDLLDLVQYVAEKGIITDILRNPFYYFQRYRHSETEFLYNLEVDPDELHNLIEERADLASEFKSILKVWEDECRTIRERSEVSRTEKTIDDKTVEQLRQLGYTE